MTIKKQLSKIKNPRTAYMVKLAQKQNPQVLLAAEDILIVFKDDLSPSKKQAIINFAVAVENSKRK